MAAIPPKQRLFEESGYRFDFDRDVYVNRAQRKVFSIEFIEEEEHPAQFLRDRIEEQVPEGEWRFYFNRQPSPAVRRELEEALG